MAIIGALTHAPKHSASEMVNNLSGVVSPTSMPNFVYSYRRKEMNKIRAIAVDGLNVFLQNEHTRHVFKTVSEFRSQHGVVVHI